MPYGLQWGNLPHTNPNDDWSARLHQAFDLPEPSPPQISHGDGGRGPAPAILAEAEAPAAPLVVTTPATVELALTLSAERTAFGGGAHRQAGNPRIDVQ